jgi:hypothetical protein
MIQEVNGVYQIMGKEQDLRRNRPTWWDCRWLTHMAGLQMTDPHGIKKEGIG